MADALSMSMGGRVASIYKQNTKRRRFTTVMNEIESKRLAFLKKQIENDRSTEEHRLERTTTKVTNSNDELKAFQIALLRRIRTVREQNKVTASSRPLINLGRYGGATIEQVKIESEKFKRIRDPEKRRRIKAKIYLEQGKRDGRIKSYDPEDIGKLAQNILQLYSAVPYNPLPPIQANKDIANLEDVEEADDNEDELHFFTRQVKPQVITTWNSYPPNPAAKLALPPVHVRRSLDPNANYHRKASVDYQGMQDENKPSAGRGLSPIHTRLSVLENLSDGMPRKRANDHSKEKASAANKIGDGVFPVTSLRTHDAKLSGDVKLHSKTKNYEWNHQKPVGAVQTGKYLNDSQKFWKQKESIPFSSKKRVVLPKIG